MALTQCRAGADLATWYTYKKGRAATRSPPTRCLDLLPLPPFPPPPTPCVQVAANGSVQDLDIPENLKALYKTVWEIKQRVLVDMAADRGAYIDQSQSFNVFMSDPNFGKLTSLHFYAWKKGLKTGMYYLRTR